MLFFDNLKTKSNTFSYIILLFYDKSIKNENYMLSKFIQNSLLLLYIHLQNK